ncbi:MAG: transcription-repair coupling factor [Proteobacteria bacterium]|nr:transcription-repair coupling factor [Pseudomonadota bacterium]
MSPLKKPTTALKKRVIGLSGSACGWFLASTVREHPRSLVVCPDRKTAEDLLDDLHFFLGNGAATMFPSWETLPLEPVSPGAELSAVRIKTIYEMTTNPSFLVVTTAESLLQRILPPASITALRTIVRVGEPLNRESFISRLIDAGFSQSRTVDEIGEFSAKGSVIDLFPSSTKHPVRIEIRSGVVVRMQSFNADSQRSLADIDISEVEILPVRELLLPLWYAQNRPEVTRKLKERAVQTGTPPREVEKILQALEQGDDYPGLELLQYIAAPPLPTLLDILPANTIVHAVDKHQILRSLAEFSEISSERASRLVEEQHLIPQASDIYIDYDTASAQLTNLISYELSGIDDSLDKNSSINIRSESTLDLATRMHSAVGSGQAFQPLKEYLNQWRSKNFSVAFSVGSTSRAQRLQSILLDIGSDAPVLTGTAQGWINAPRRPAVAIIVGHLNSGCRLPKEKLCFISENEVFSERSYRSSKTPQISAKRLLSTLSLLKEGDFVVHIDYGIGVYQGLKHLTVEGVLGDFVQIDYSDSRLYLPAHQIGKIQKFVATEGQQPHIDKLGSTRWFRTKQKIRDSIVTLAGDLIRLYASRSVARGWRFEPLGAEDERFADSFPYDETPDQRKAIKETLNDLANDKPMDRLVCGDVGFGKTEVAIRAAFKCFQHARQVAILVPTTILVEQHKKNFAGRFAGYPAKIGAISRFYSPAENQKTLAAIARGEIDIVIGTHRLLQPDVQFKDLGLLIIDEEHRFGVKQKERLRSYRTNVDVLTLTATPIPRTLHMSLLDIRDISLIHTAPVDRKVIQSYVAERDDSLVRDAILRELRRGGQAFYIHNRVQNIGLITAHLAELVPEAKFEFAHGQMSETTLEPIMRRFLERKIDVLISTTIVESGLDIPNANTIIIDRADQFGLAQLYQLRGRVGRAKRQAYAYFIVPHLRSLSGQAHERLKVLQSLDSLGAGFNLAIRDLEIRGAGNLLGKEQSGNVLSVGFDMYCRILHEAVADLKGEEPQLEDIIDPDIRIVGVDAFIPEAYVPDIGERLVLYQRLSNIRNNDEAADLQSEIEDRFGPCSIEVDNLMLLMRYRGLLRAYGVVKSELTPLKISLTFSPLALLRDGYKPTCNTRVDGLKALQLVQKHPHTYRFGRGNTLSIILKEGETASLPDLFRRVLQVLETVGYGGSEGLASANL